MLQLLGQKDWTLCVPHQADLSAAMTDNTPLSYGQRALLQEHRRSNIDGCTNYEIKDLSKMECQHVNLHPGDTLYLPKGVIHYATTAPNVTSAHMTFGLYRNGNTWARVLRKRCHLLFADPVCHQINTVVDQASRTVVGLPWLGMASVPLSATYGPNTTVEDRLAATCTQLSAMVNDASLPYSLRSLVSSSLYQPGHLNAYTISTPKMLSMLEQLARCDDAALREVLVDHETRMALTRSRRSSYWSAAPCVKAVWLNHGFVACKYSNGSIGYLLDLRV